MLLSDILYNRLSLGEFFMGKHFFYALLITLSCVPNKLIGAAAIPKESNYYLVTSDDQEPLAKALKSISNQVGLVIEGNKKISGW